MEENIIIKNADRNGGNANRTENGSGNKKNRNKQEDSKHRDKAGGVYANSRRGPSFTIRGSDRNEDGINDRNLIRTVGTNTTDGV